MTDACPGCGGGNERPCSCTVKWIEMVGGGPQDGELWPLPLDAAARGRYVEPYPGARTFEWQGDGED